jgi:hypothetical protein
VTWATAAEVAEITGVTVSDPEVAAAAGVIELHSGRLQTDTGLRARDLTWLKRAVAYQAAWAKAQADLLTRAEVRSWSQDGASASQAGEDQILAPLAKRALRRLSTRGNRSVYTRSTLTTTRDPDYRLGVDGVTMIHDYPWENWTPL